MNIREAKEQIIHTVRAYLERDEEGRFVIPVEKQRPVLIMGPPGIGKTAIMEQIARECGINLVSYTITHHTRQSAIGLPFISKRNYDGKEVAVTEYTMSEIIAAVYDKIAASGVREGILFLDEINCVSETLSPTMLQFLQYKTFGTHRIPDGFLIVTAGNPPEYNASVRDFDIVTLDRVRRIDVDADYEAWNAYALQEGVHPAIIAYLSIRKEHFYSVQATPEGKRFVTARGWEDLSRTVQMHETLGLKVDKKLVRQFLQEEQIADAFATYYELWNKYRDVYDTGAILAGAEPADAEKETLRKAPFDEKLSLISMITDALTQDARRCCMQRDIQALLRERLLAAKELAEEEEDAAGAEQDSVPALSEMLGALAQTMRETLARREAAGMTAREEAAVQKGCIAALQEAAALPGLRDKEGGFAALSAYFAEREETRLREADECGARMDAAFRWFAQVFGEGQEIVLLLTQLSAGAYTLRFVNEHGNESYFRYNRLLLLDERRQALTEEIRAFSLG